MYNFSGILWDFTYCHYIYELFCNMSADVELEILYMLEDFAISIKYAIHFVGN